MNVVTHAAVGLALSRFFPPACLPASVAFSVLPDADRLLSLREWKSKDDAFRSPRSAMHGLLGAAVYSLVGLLAAMIDRQIGTLFLICVATHLFLDFISGVSVPFQHIKKDPAKISFGSSQDKPPRRRFWVGCLQEASVIAISLLIYTR